MDDIMKAVRPAALEVPVSGIISTVNHGRDKDGLIPLWAGEGDLPTPQFIVEAAKKSLDDGETFYTHQRGIPPLREALAAYYEAQYGRPFDPDTFFVTGSGMQAIQLSLQLVAGAGNEVLVPTPTWPNVTGAALALGARPVAVPMRESNASWQLDLADLKAAVTPATTALFLNTPANPTGWTASLQTLEGVLSFCRERGLWIIADEIYARFVYGNSARAPSLLDICNPDDRILFVNTFSKNWAMTGWRMGWIHAPLPLRQTMENLIQYSTSGVPTFTQRAGVTALRDGEWFVEEMIERARTGRAIVTEALAGNERVIYQPPQGAFYAFFRVLGLENAKEAAVSLIDRASVGTAPGTAFGANGEGFVRICFARSADSMREAMIRMGSFLAH
ncbi:MAG: pyridoxal phosphate-dependent aminotransferase [Pseudomonadota bacterium]